MDTVFDLTLPALDESEFLEGKNIPVGSLEAEFLRICAFLPSNKSSPRVEQQLHSVESTFVGTTTEPASPLLPRNAAPPKLHYFTFWKHVGREMYNRHIADVKNSARDEILRRSNV
jgi:hypothetical protein